MITVIEYLFLALLTLGTGLGSAYIVYMVVEPKAKRLISGYTNTIPARMRKELGSALKDMTENIDLGEIAGQIGDEGGGLGDIAGLLGGKGGGLGDLLKLFMQFSGKGKEGGGSSGW